jgi:hypothetical protein
VSLLSSFLCDADISVSKVGKMPVGERTDQLRQD